MTRTIAITNQKGGSGKTTTAVNLAAALGEAGKRVLLVDLDPQGSATMWLGVQRFERSVHDLFTRGVSIGDVTIAVTSAPGVALVPAGAQLTQAERNLGGDFEALGTLHRAFDALPGGSYDVVLVDCPPAVAFLTPAALLACRELVIPVEARAMALQGLAGLLDRVKRMAAPPFNHAPSIAGILPCRVDARTNLSREVVDALRGNPQIGALVFETVIRENVRLAEAPSYALPITLFAPNSPGAADYRAAAAELLARTPSTAVVHVS